MKTINNYLLKQESCHEVNTTTTSNRQHGISCTQTAVKSLFDFLPIIDNIFVYVKEMYPNITAIYLCFY